MKHPLLPVLSLLVLTACSSIEATETDSSSSTSIASITSSTSSASGIIEPYPMELTVEHFKNMTLSGTNLEIGRVLEQNAAYKKYYITYTSNTVLVSGTFSIPNGDGPFPLVIQNHGYIDPAVYTNGRGLRREQDAMARAGFAVLHTDYRKHAQSDPDPDKRNIYDAGLAYAMDSANAVLAVRELNDPRIDARKVGMLGHSMGGGVTLHILVAHPELIDAAVLYAPVNSDSWKNFERWRMDGDDAQPTLDALGTYETQPAKWEALSPMDNLIDVEDPILLFQGTNDKDVPAVWSDDLDHHLRALNKDIRYVSYPGEGHEFAGKWSDFINQTIAFFRENLE